LPLNFRAAVTYRVVVRAQLAAGAAVLAAALTATALATPSETTTLRLDGVQLRPELALTPAQRTRGLMLRRPAPADGMLFVFPSDTTGGFWMKNTLVPLRILFFEASGTRVRMLSMTPCRRDPCRVYEPGRRYRFALELRASDTRPGRVLGPAAELRRLTRRAT
jgi:uncharacterized membrane protein (UPF0127 family)